MILIQFSDIQYPTSSVIMCPCMFGFTRVGVAAGSCAACFQSCCYGAMVPDGSCFAQCTSAGMRGKGYSCCATPHLTCFWLGIALLLAGGLALYLTGAYMEVVPVLTGAYQEVEAFFTGAYEEVGDFFTGVANFFCGLFTTEDGCRPPTYNGTNAVNETVAYHQSLIMKALDN